MQFYVSVKITCAIKVRINRTYFLRNKLNIFRAKTHNVNCPAADKRDEWRFAMAKFTVSSGFENHDGPANKPPHSLLARVL